MIGGQQTSIAFCLLALLAVSQGFAIRERRGVGPAISGPKNSGYVYQNQPPSLNYKPQIEQQRQSGQYQPLYLGGEAPLTVPVDNYVIKHQLPAGQYQVGQYYFAAVGPYPAGQGPYADLTRPQGPPKVGGHPAVTPPTGGHNSGVGGFSSNFGGNPNYNLNGRN